MWRTNENVFFATSTKKHGNIAGPNPHVKTSAVKWTSAGVRFLRFNKRVQVQPRLKILNPFQVYLLVMVRASSALAAPASGRLQSALALALASALAPAFAAASTFTALHLSIIACESASLKRAA